MSKAIVTKLFIGGIVAIFAGLLVGVFAGILAFGSMEVVMNGPEVSAFHATPFAWTMIAVATVGFLVMVGGAVAGLVSWIGALLNTAQLDDKVWFIVLLVLGLFSFGFFAMVAYVIAGPDSTQAQRRAAAQPVT
jgi:hypothetical protein